MFLTNTVAHITEPLHFVNPFRSKETPMKHVSEYRKQQNNPPKGAAGFLLDRNPVIRRKISVWGRLGPRTRDIHGVDIAWAIRYPGNRSSRMTCGNPHGYNPMFEISGDDAVGKKAPGIPANAALRRNPHPKRAGFMVAGGLLRKLMLCPGGGLHGKSPGADPKGNNRLSGGAQSESQQDSGKYG